MSALHRLQELQEKNSAARAQQWKQKCYPNKEAQRELIVRNLSERFMKDSVLAGLQELRVQGGNSAATRRTSVISVERPSTAPQTHKFVGNFGKSQALTEEGDEHHLGRTRKNVNMQSSNQDKIYADQIRIKLQQRPNSAHEKRKQFLSVLTAPTGAIEQHILDRNLEEQRMLESRDPMSVFQYLKDHVNGAVPFKLRGDQFGTKQELDLRKVIKKVDGSGARRLGIAIVFDPSIVTDGHHVTLRFKYVLDPNKNETHTTTNVMNGNRQTNAAHNFASSHGLPSPFASTGVLQRSTSMPTKEAAVLSYKENPTMSKSSSNLLNIAAAGHPSQASTSMHLLHNRQHKLGISQKPKHTTVEVDYRINSARKYKYDIKLTTSPKVATLPIVNDLPMFLPGWEGCLPIFIPAEYAVCQIFSTKTAEADSWQTGSAAMSWNPSPLNSRPASARSSRPTSANYLSRPSSALRTNQRSGTEVELGNQRNHHATLDVIPDGQVCHVEEDPENDALEPGNTATGCVSLSGFAFPIESVYRALHALKKELSSDAYKQLGNFMVPGGQPALHIAALYNNSDACRSLLSNGADVNFKNKPNQLTALHEAVTGGSRDCVEVLLEHGAKLSMSDVLGNTPLHTASEMGDIPCANVLMRYKEAAHVLLMTNKAGKIPLDVCTSVSMRQTIERGMRMYHLAVPSQRVKKTPRK